MIITPKENLVEKDGFDVPTQTLSEGKHYFVYAIAKTRKTTRYYIIDDANQRRTMPLAYDADLFKVTDPNIPDNWQSHSSGWSIFKKQLISFPEWANDPGSQGKPGFYERLIDSNPDDIERRIIKQLNTQNSLIAEFDKALDDYARGVNANWRLSTPQIDDAMAVAALRNDIHELYQELTERGVKLDVANLKNLDSAWQKWILARIKIDLKNRNPIYTPSNFPESQWWWWIESLDSLSESQKSTL